MFQVNPKERSPLEVMLTEKLWKIVRRAQELKSLSEIVRKQSSKMPRWSGSTLMLFVSIMYGGVQLWFVFGYTSDDCVSPESLADPLVFGVACLLAPFLAVCWSYTSMDSQRFQKYLWVGTEIWREAPYIFEGNILPWWSHDHWGSAEEFEKERQESPKSCHCGWCGCCCTSQASNHWGFVNSRLRNGPSKSGAQSAG